MNPFRLLRLWRERWGMAESQTPVADYIPPTEQSWEWRLAHSDAWSLRGLPALAFAVGLLLLLPATVIVYTPAAQALIGLAMFGVALYIRRYVGMLPFMVLAGLAILATCRYLAWRWQYTLPAGPAAWPELTLWVAECYLAVMACLWIANLIWPLYRAAEPMPGAPSDWPYIDLLLQGEGADMAEIENALLLARRQQWPAERIDIFLDAHDSADIRALAQRHGITRFSSGLASRRMPALSRGNGEHVVIARVGEADSLLADPSLLHYWIAWMRRDPNLALLYSPGHSLAARMRRSVARLLAPTPAHAIAVIRRSAWRHVDASPHSPPVATQLERAGLRTAAVGHPAQPGDTEGLWRRVDDPGHAGSMRWRGFLHALRKSFNAGLPVAWAIVFAAWFAMPLLERYPIHAPFGWFAAYILPALALMALVWQRSASPQRISPWVELREWALAALMPVAMAASAWSAWRRRLHASYPRNEARVSVPAWRWLWRALAVTGVVASLLRLPAAEATARPWLACTCLVFLYLLLLEVANWAVQREADLLKSLQAGYRRLQALLRLPDGHLLPCHTLDFPADPLTLRTHGDADIAGGHGFTLTLGSEGEELRISGTLAPDHDREMHFRIAPASLPAYHAFVQRVRMRFLARQYWLPGKHLDRWFRSMFGMNATHRGRAGDFS